MNQLLDSDPIVVVARPIVASPGDKPKKVFWTRRCYGAYAASYYYTEAGLRQLTKREKLVVTTIQRVQDHLALKGSEEISTLNALKDIEIPDHVGCSKRAWEIRVGEWRTQLREAGALPVVDETA